MKLRSEIKQKEHTIRLLTDSNVCFNADWAKESELRKSVESKLQEVQSHCMKQQFELTRLQHENDQLQHSSRPNSFPRQSAVSSPILRPRRLDSKESPDSTTPNSVRRGCTY